MSWDDWSAVNIPPVVEEDKWHVALAPGEVKVVSLEQLDDLFRLSIVDAETKVWQNGMSEWQPLRVIADLDDSPAPAPAAEPKRTHPKPPSPRSAPPPPRPQSVAPPSPSVRPAPPPPRPQSVAPPSPSVRPAPPPPRTQSVAPAPVYAEPLGLAATQPAFVAPRAVQPIASVRPLVVTARPPVAQSGGGFGRFLIGLSLIAGLGISLYRNGVVRDAAQSLHQDALFARLENALGGPAFGTLRAVEQGATARLGSGLTSDLNASLAADAPVATPSVPAEPEAARPAAEPPGNAAPQTPVVSLESLQPEKAGSVRPKVEAAANPAPASAPTVAAAKLVTQPKLAATPQVKAAPVKPAAVEKPVASKPASEMTERERLNAAIGQSMLSAPPKSKSKSKSKSNEYDPLNPQL